MDAPNVRPRLIIVCGLPGAGKTTHATALAACRGAVRFCPNEWLAALALDLHDKDRRARKWALGQELLRQGCTVIIEWGTWARAERDVLRLGARALGAAVELHYLVRWSALLEVPTADELALFDAPTGADHAPDPG